MASGRVPKMDRGFKVKDRRQRAEVGGRRSEVRDQRALTLIQVFTLGCFLKIIVEA